MLGWEGLCVHAQVPHGIRSVMYGLDDEMQLDILIDDL